MQSGQVILTPISHYVVGIVGGVLYGVTEGAVLNWIGRMIGHVSAYALGYFIGQRIIRYFFDDEDFHSYRRFVTGSKETLHWRLIIIFSILFLPLFPDDELSYLVGLAAFPFRYYFPILALGHVGGSLGLAYIGAGIDTKDTLFWVMFILVLFLACVFVYAVKQINRNDAE